MTVTAPCPEVRRPEKSITSIRDAIEHIDGVIVDGPTLKPGDAHLLAIDHAGEHLEIGTDRLTFHALAASLRGLHRVGVQMLEVLPYRVPEPNTDASAA